MPQESKTTENEVEPPKTKLLSQAEQFFALTLSSKSTERPRASESGPDSSAPLTLA